jgi:hypothetical protein
MKTKYRTKAEYSYLAYAAVLQWTDPSMQGILRNISGFLITQLILYRNRSYGWSMSTEKQNTSFWRHEAFIPSSYWLRAQL